MKKVTFSVMFTGILENGSNLRLQYSGLLFFTLHKVQYKAKVLKIMFFLFVFY